MPLFDLSCDAGHTEERLCSAAEAESPGICFFDLGLVLAAKDGGSEIRSICGRPLRRRLSAPASSFPGAASWRK